MMSEADYPFSIRPLTRAEGGGYLIEYPDLPGCMSDGETIEEAIANGRDACARRGAKCLRPGPIQGPAIPESGFCALADRARREGVSLNMLAVALLAKGLGRREAT
jgi:antitoxin HicB